MECNCAKKFKRVPLPFFVFTSFYCKHSTFAHIYHFLFLETPCGQHLLIYRAAVLSKKRTKKCNAFKEGGSWNCKLFEKQISVLRAHLFDRF